MTFGFDRVVVRVVGISISLSSPGIGRSRFMLHRICRSRRRPGFVIETMTTGQVVDILSSFFAGSGRIWILILSPDGLRGEEKQLIEDQTRYLQEGPGIIRKHKGGNDKTPPFIGIILDGDRKSSERSDSDRKMLNPETGCYSESVRAWDWNATGNVRVQESWPT